MKTRMVEPILNSDNPQFGPKNGTKNGTKSKALSGLPQRQPGPIWEWGNNPLEYVTYSCFHSAANVTDHGESEVPHG